jgi:hypothetical protein
MGQPFCRERDKNPKIRISEPGMDKKSMRFQDAF